VATAGEVDESNNGGLTITTFYNLRLRHTIVHLVRRFLRRFGYLKVDYGFACGRYWVEIDGKVISQTSATHVWLCDDDVHRLGYAIIDHGKHWNMPNTRPHAPERNDDIVPADVRLVREFFSGVEFALSLAERSDICGISAGLANDPESYRSGHKSAVDAIARYLQPNDPSKFSSGREE
jgi:hypothetical protein